MDVNLERTNSSCVVISPGCGVFDVDRELTGLTKQRLMDSGMYLDIFESEEAVEFNLVEKIREVVRYDEKLMNRKSYDVEEVTEPICAVEVTTLRTG